MDLFGLKKRFSTVKSAAYSVSNLIFEKGKDFFTWGNNGKGIKAYLNSYASNPLVYMVVNKISQTTAAMPRVVQDAKGNELKESIVKSIIENPNRNQSQIEFNEEANESLLLAGNTYILFEKSPEDMDQAKDKLFVLKPDKICPKFNRFGLLWEWEYTDEFGRVQHYLPENILHIKTSNIVQDDKTHYNTGLSPLEAGWIVVESSDQKFEAEASIFKNRGIIGILSSGTDTPMLPKERKQMQEEYDAEMGGASKFNKVKISSTKMQYMQTGMSPTDLKLLEGIISSLRLICGLFGMPSVLFNDTANSSFNNYSTAVTVSYSDVYVPLANKIDEKLGRFLSEKYGVDETIAIDASRVDGIKTPTNAVAQSLGDLSPLLANKIVANMTPNEVRDVVNLGKIENGDTIPANQPAEPGLNVNV